MFLDCNHIRFYRRISSLNPFRVYYKYLDTADYKITNQLKDAVNYIEIHKEFQTDNKNFKVIICKIKKSIDWTFVNILYNCIIKEAVINSDYFNIMQKELGEI